MTFNPQTLLDLQAFWRTQGGRSLGIKGDAAHTWGYHLGRNRIFTIPPGRGDRDPSVRHPRDRAGLTNAASAIDLGRLGGSIPRLRGFSSWLVTQCRNGAPGTDDIAEIIWTDTAEVTWYYSSSGGRRVHRLPPDSRAAQTHQGHTHISFYRDSEARDKVSLFRPFFDEEEEDSMPTITTYIAGHSAILRAGARVRDAAATTGSLLRTVPPGGSEPWPAVVGWVTGRPASGSDQWLVRWHDGRWEYVHATHVVWLSAPSSSDAALANLRAQLAARTAERDAAQDRLAEVQAEVRAHVEAGSALWARVKLP